MDETALFFAMPPDKGLATKQMSGKKGNKDRLTLAFTVNADGSERLPPLFIGHHQRKRCFRGKSAKDLGFYYFWNKKGWIMSSIFQKYMILLTFFKFI